MEKFPAESLEEFLEQTLELSKNLDGIHESDICGTSDTIFGWVSKRVHEGNFVEIPEEILKKFGEISVNTLWNSQIIV